MTNEAYGLLCERRVMNQLMQIKLLCMKTGRLVVVFAMLLCINSSYADLDRETLYARKCYSLLRHYEKKYHIPDDTLFAIALQESGTAHSIHGKKIISPWSVNVEGVGHVFKSREEAVSFVKHQLKLGKKSIDVGLMQVNLLHHPYAFKSVEHAFDVRANIEYAAYFLVSKYNQLGNWATAIAHYHSATPDLGSKYKNSISKIAKNIDTHKMTLHYKYANQASRVNKNAKHKMNQQLVYRDIKNTPEVLPLNPRRSKNIRSTYVD